MHNVLAYMYIDVSLLTGLFFDTWKFDMSLCPTYVYVIEREEWMESYLPC